MGDFLIKLTNKQKIILGVIAVIIMIIIFVIAYKYFYIDNNPNNIQEASQAENTTEGNIIEETEDEESYDSADSADSAGILNTKKKKITILVHVIGEVNKPGVVKLTEGGRIIDAIEAAGGQTENADLSKVNLAYEVEDGTQIYIPSYKDNIENIALISDNAGEGVIKESAVNNRKNETSSKVNINTAEKEKLMTLPGIGESMANKIIDYRTQNGKFNNIEDIKNVSGIGDSKYNNIKDLITIK